MFCSMFGGRARAAGDMSTSPRSGGGIHLFSFFRVLPSQPCLEGLFSGGVGLWRLFLHNAFPVGLASHVVWARRQVCFPCLPLPLRPAGGILIFFQAAAQVSTVPACADESHVGGQG